MLLNCAKTPQHPVKTPQHSLCAPPQPPLVYQRLRCATVQQKTTHDSAVTSTPLAQSSTLCVRVPAAPRTPFAYHRLRRAIVREERMCRDSSASCSGGRLELRFLVWRLPAAFASGAQPCYDPTHPGTRPVLYTPILCTTGCAAQPCQPSDTDVMH